MFTSAIKRLKKARGFIAGLGIATAAFLFINARQTDPYFEISKNLDIFTNIFKELNGGYVDPVEPGRLLKVGVDAMLEELDPYTNYISESDLEDYQFQITGKYGGIGASMRTRAGDVVISDVYENSPAQKAGLHPGDVVVAIDGQAVKNKRDEEISMLLKGAPGTPVTLLVKDVFTGAETQKMLTRGEIELSSVPYAGLVGAQKNIAFVRLTQFTPGCSRMVRAALDSIKTTQPNLKGVVLDLRNNPGGLLSEAVAMCNLFVEKGQVVVTTKGKSLNESFATQGAVWDAQIPVTVLINQSSASASEIVAGTMQDLDRGVVVGSRSYGKGLVQVTRSLGYNAQLKLTTARYYTPSGRCIQAIDYSNRNADGSAANVPDSLKMTYKTRAGRKVLSGGGVEPDVAIVDEPISRLAIALFVKNYMFDYATQYVKQHPTIAPAATFQLTDADFNQFAQWLDNKDYSYKTATEIAVDSLKAVAIREKYFDGMKAEFATLQAKVSHDKKQDLLKHKTELMHFLESDIVSRYYYQRGRIENSLRYDEDLSKAIALLEKPTEYSVLLTPKR